MDESQDVDFVGREETAVMEQVDQPIHVDHEEGQEVEQQHSGHCHALPVHRVVGFMKRRVLAFGVLPAVS